jgi:hypothetical protein
MGVHQTSQKFLLVHLDPILFLIRIYQNVARFCAVCYQLDLPTFDAQGNCHPLLINISSASP